MFGGAGADAGAAGWAAAAAQESALRARLPRGTRRRQVDHEQPSVALSRRFLGQRELGVVLASSCGALR